MVSSTSGTSASRFGAFLQFIAVSVVAGIVGAGLAIPSMGVASVGAKNVVDIFNALPAELEERPLAKQSRMLAADGSEIATFYWHNRQEVPLDKISKDMQNATVAIEDERFFEHSGVDLQGIARAMVHNLFSSTKQGGSTLTQQYVKNVLAENAHSEDDEAGVDAAKEADGTAGYARKLREAKLATAVEKKYGKEEILNRYMNINNYSGSPNVYGVEAAAYRYWGIQAKDLDAGQAATLAGIVQNPSAYNPQSRPEAALERRNVVLGQMLKFGYISQEEYDKQTAKKDLGLDIHETPNGCSAAGNMAYFCDYVQRVIEQDENYGETKEDRERFLQRGGVTIQTSIQPKIQKMADKAVKDRVPVGDPSGAGHSLVTIEPGTGKIIAMAQNRNYSVVEGKKNADTQLNFNVDRAHNGANGFQVGSTWKPFVLAEWINSGRGLNESVDASKRNYSAGSWRYEGCTPVGGSWNPNNAGDGKGSSSMSVLDATKNSVNTAYAAMGNQLNMCGIMETAKKLGVKYGSGEPLDEPQPNWEGERILYTSTMPSSILGTAEIAPLDMANAYAVFASGGTYCNPSPITKITQQDGKEVEIPDPNCHQAVDERVANSVAYALTQTFKGGTTSSLGIGVPAGAKTGTTNFEVGSTWLLGFTKKLSTAVWTGNPDGVKDWRKNRKGAVRGQVYGATYSGRTWQAFMRQAVKETKGNSGFSNPGGGGSGGADNTGANGPGNNNSTGGNGGSPSLGGD